MLKLWLFLASYIVDTARVVVIKALKIPCQNLSTRKHSPENFKSNETSHSPISNPKKRSLHLQVRPESPQSPPSPTMEVHGILVRTEC